MIYRSPHPDLDIPDCTLTELVFRAARQRPDHPAFIDGVTGQTITFSEWSAAVKRGAAGLASRGFQKGDVLAIFSPNVPEYSIAIHSVALNGGVVTTANPLATAGELRKQLQDCEARYVVTVPDFLPKVEEAVRGLGIAEVFVVGGESQPEGKTDVPHSDFADLLACTGPAPNVDVRPDDVCALPYSSGTTGLPKGVMLTHRNLVANVEQCQAVLGYDASDRFLAFLPYFHIYGLVVIMHCTLRIGATQVTIPRFEMKLFLELLERYRITVAHLVPPVALLLANDDAVDGYDLSALHQIFTGAAPISADLVKRCCDRLQCDIGQGYGLTETSPGAVLASPATYKASPGTVGVPVPNTEIKVVDENRQMLPNGERGEICIRGPQVMKGYLRQSEATADMIDADGWLHSGDIGYANVKGHFFIVDRAKELIKYKGNQVAPAELEALLLTHPAIVDAAVIGILDEEAGELPKGYVVLSDALAPEAIQEFVASQVAPYKKLRLIEIVDQIPKSPSGKILRRVLRDRA